MVLLKALPNSFNIGILARDIQTVYAKALLFKAHQHITKVIMQEVYYQKKDRAFVQRDYRTLSQILSLRFLYRSQMGSIG